MDKLFLTYKMSIVPIQGVDDIGLESILKLNVNKEEMDVDDDIRGQDIKNSFNFYKSVYQVQDQKQKEVEEEEDN